MHDAKITHWKLGEWYGTTPSGITHLSFTTQAFLPPGSQTVSYDDPKGRYLLIEDHFCSGDQDPKLLRQAFIEFSNLPGFSCLRLSAVASVMPMTDERATDSGGIFSYSPPPRAELGSRVTVYAHGLCVGSITIEQRDEWGLRYLRAEDAFRKCTDREDRKFFASEPPSGRGTGAEQAKITARACGGFGAFFPNMETSAPVLPSARRESASQCSGK